ncbi:MULTISPECIES: Fe-S cluster assembly sulfur transfer protein SufU [unclassified Streptomyces]|uniref:Fe-S cluster assembly sulfur transfer protein SufU n=1 Tax=unclassified Streptomyces TaxID=2593676 RepID=UPI002E1B955B|nr:SUF system NifU family Fe-S cluster assembly protein [Streptomyces sp. NBC_01023]
MRLTKEDQAIILAHYRAPHHSGLREPYDLEVRQFNPMCGDDLTLRVSLTGEGDGAAIDDVSYEVQGCSISQASVSVMTDLVIGRGVREAAELHTQFATLLRGRAQEQDAWPPQLADAAAFRDVSQHPARIKCALLSWTALRKALPVSRLGGPDGV